MTWSLYACTLAGQRHHRSLPLQPPATPAPLTHLQDLTENRATHVDFTEARENRSSQFSFLSFCFDWRRGGGAVTWLWFLFLVFPGLQGAVQKMTIIIILIIIILIIVTCIHSIFVVRQQEQIPPTCYNKGPDSTHEQLERVYMSAFIEFNKVI